MVKPTQNSLLLQSNNTSGSTIGFKDFLLIEALDLVKISEPKINKPKIIELITKALNEKGAPESKLKEASDYFNSLSKLFGYNKLIHNSDILVYYYLGARGLELHFVDLFNIEKTGEDTNTNDSSLDIFAYVISVLFKELKSNKAISIVAPLNNPRRLSFYLTLCKYVIKKYNMNVAPIVNNNVISFQPLVLKEKTNPYLLA